MYEAYCASMLRAAYFEIHSSSITYIPSIYMDTGQVLGLCNIRISVVFRFALPKDFGNIAPFPLQILEDSGYEPCR